MSRHQKRVTVPRSWPIQRKIHKWVAKSSPGPHSAEDSITLLTVLRDMLKLADNAREAKRILYEGKVLVDGKVKKDYKLPIGIFDIISIPLQNQQYRVLKDTRGMFYLSPTEDAKKLVKIKDKTILKGNKQQLNLSDGSNKLAEGEFKASDSLILSVPEKKIEDKIEFRAGNIAMVIGGKHTGQIGKIKDIIIMKSSQPNRIVISGDGNKEFETIVDYVYMIGRDEPIFKLEAVR